MNDAGKTTFVGSGDVELVEQSGENRSKEGSYDNEYSNEYLTWP